MKFFAYDSNMSSNKAAINTAKLALMSRQIVADNKKYINAAGASNPTTIIIDANVLIVVGDSFFKTSATTLTPSNLDTGTSFTMGNDYYIYICDPTSGDDSIDNNEVYKISLSTTYPTGYNATNSRKIGGFHYGVVRKVDSYYRPINSSGTALGSGWQTNVYTGIVPNSVWTLLHRPKCSPEGMVYLNGDLWGDIYLASTDGGSGLKSVYNANPMTGTEGMNWYGFVERARLVGKRLPTYAEFCAAALGSPAGEDDNNTYAWSATTNGGRARTGSVTNAVSSYNVRDLVGNVWKWVDDIFLYEGGSTTWGWQNIQADLQKGGILDGSCGDMYALNATSLLVLLCGGHWHHGALDGRRAVHLGFYPWRVDTGFGVWCVCDSL